MSGPIVPVVAALVLTCAIADARAQELYVIGGWQTNRREPGWKPSPQTPSQPPPSSVQSVAMGAGVWLSPDVGVEGSFGVYRAQSIAWHYSYMSAADELTDALLVNPHDPDQIADAVHVALVMSLDERRARHEGLLDKIYRTTAKTYFKCYVAALKGSPVRN